MEVIGATRVASNATLAGSGATVKLTRSCGRFAVMLDSGGLPLPDLRGSDT